jgi:hypothetical protein
MCWAAFLLAALSILLKEPGPLDEVASELAASVESHSQERFSALTCITLFELLIRFFGLPYLQDNFAFRSPPCSS